MLKKSSFQSRLEMVTIKLYFITQNENFGTSMVLSPRIPKSIDFENNEDNKTARICVCENVASCIKSVLPNIYQGTHINIYSCDVNKEEVYKPTSRQVPDVDITHELWLLKNTKFTLEQKIWFSQEKTIQDIFNDINYLECKSQVNQVFL